MNMKKIKFIISILLISILLSTMSPFLVYALNQEDVSTYLKDGSNEVDFNYKCNLNETFDIVYNQGNIAEYIKNYIHSKIGNEYEVKVEENNKYKIILNQEEIYSGIFSYSLLDTIEINMNQEENTIELIKNYILENTNFLENINIKQSNTDKYIIEINGIRREFKVNFSNIKEQTKTIEMNPRISYQTHIEKIGWQNFVYDGNTSGTEGQRKRLEAIKIVLQEQPYEGNIEYKTHIQKIGWETTWSKNGEQSGTSGKSLRLEAIQIRLTGEMEQHYDIYYRVHAEKFGWLDWAKNGENAGTAGYAYRLEAIQIKLVKKNENAPGPTTKAFVQRYIGYQTHIESIGWQGVVYDGSKSGTEGQRKRLEAIKIALQNQLYDGNIEYRTHIQKIGWETTWSKNGEQSGTSGKSLRLEAIQIRLTGDMEQHYDIYYRVHAEKFGWLGWAKNGESAGTAGYAYRLEAIEIYITPKGTVPDVTSQTAFVAKEDTSIEYSAHVSSIGWQEYVKNGESAGTTGLKKDMEALKINLNTSLPGEVVYQTYIENRGWQNEVRTNQISGTVGEARHIEAIRIKLTDQLGEIYDIYYRTHVSGIGWLDWAKNGANAGSSGADKAIEAVEIVLVSKNSAAPGSTAKAYATGHWETKNGNRYYYDYFGNMANDFKIIDGVKYFFNSLGVLIGSNVRQVIDVSKWQGVINWAQVKKYSNINGVIVRAAYRGYGTEGNIVEDEYFYDNVKGAKAQGFSVGAYFYSQAITTKEAEEEADKIIGMVQKAGGLSLINMPIIFDTEFTTCNENGITHCGRADNLTKQQRTNIAKAFLEKVKKAGYTPMIYASTSFLNNQLDMHQLSNYQVWVAEYNHFVNYGGSYKGWQYSSTENISGITGGVDSSVWF